MKAPLDTFILIQAIDIAAEQGGVVRPIDVERAAEAGAMGDAGVSRYAVRKAFRGFALDNIFILEGNKYRYNPGNTLYLSMIDAFRTLDGQR